MDSFIMGLVEVAARPGMISFATGLPDNSLFDLAGVRHAVDAVLEEDGGCSLQYDSPTGFIPLREWIADRCGSELGFDVDASNVIMTNGSQECFDQLGRLFLNPGDGMVVENPGYLGALQSFSSYSPDFIPVDVTPGGIDLEQLDAALSCNPKLFYSIPNHQNPSGNSYSLDTRRQVASMIRDSGCLMIEDDAYGELGFDGRVGPTMKSMSPEDVVLTGSFSKTISPGMRVGWMVVPDWMVPMASKSVEAASLQSCTFSQRVIHRFLCKNDYDAYLVGLRNSYAEKKRFFLDAMEDALPDTVSWNNPDGGMFVWLEIPEGYDSMKVFEGCLERGLVVMPGAPFHVHGGGNAIRLNFATPTREQIIQGMSILAEVCRRM
ncbi:MAG: PLP-dependent aminotransferase family protein [Candidatus Methanomethylophilaceae archaeon]|nr:PLP-dependent aminotransferase family protein [Candidatus Methanomethylophilaceae archaeon]